jgi:2-succinyl-5-enolpyruvyl-6-hydroxy-3-cyclohexene-1-carboxylate synthase
VTDTACTGLRWALALLDGLVAGGTERLVLSPGSRSTPVVLAAQRRPGLESVPILDERSAAFFALGTARASGRPVALLCTSGSAAGHWLPAVIEADATGVPLVLLTADRPPTLRGWGANQTIDQTRLFGVFVRAFHDAGMPADDPAALKAVRALGARAAAVSSGRHAGPVHLNLPFPEPLVPAGECEAAAVPTAPSAPSRWPRPEAGLPDSDLLSGLLRGRGILVCGPGTDPGGLAGPLWRCADRLALPVLADPLSGLRFGPGGRGRVAGYDGLLRNPSAARALRPDWVIRLGAAPVSKTLLEWLTGTATVLVDPAGRWRDPTHDARIQIESDPLRFCEQIADGGLVRPDPAWLERWVCAEARTRGLADDYLAEAPWCEPHLIRTLLDRLPAGAALFSANSLPIRQLDAWSGTRDRPLAVHCNRGASGIDGNLSTLAGLNAGGLPTLGILGDLALFHDLSGLLLTERLRLPLVVVNNGGGRIFDYLPQHGLPGFEALWRTPVALDMGKLAELVGMPHRAVTNAEGFAEALEAGLDAARPPLIEVRIDAESSRTVHQGFWRRLALECLIPTEEVH